MASKRKLYLVTMYRWGDTEEHSYVLGVFTKKHRAIEAGQNETEWRGGKYYPQVLEADPDPTEEEMNKLGSVHLKVVHKLPEMHPLSGLPMHEHQAKRYLTRKGTLRE